MSLAAVIGTALVELALVQMHGNACGSIGVRVHPMTAALADSLGMTAPYGAIFGRPARGGPAAQAKIEAGDVVVKINGSTLSNWRDFAPAIAKMAPETTVYHTTWRNRQLIDVGVTVGYGRCPTGRAARSAVSLDG
jgi:serine protease Do